MNDRSKELDGLRGIAILLVIAHHVLKRADYFTANGFLHFITRLSLVGWMGVDIFCAFGFPDHIHFVESQRRKKLLQELLCAAGAAHFSAVLCGARPVPHRSEIRPRRGKDSRHRHPLFANLPALSTELAIPVLDLSLRLFERYLVVSH